MLEKVLPKIYNLGNNKETVSTLLKETTEATSLIYKKHSPDILPISDISYIAKTLEVNGVLNTKSLLEVSKILKLSSINLTSIDFNVVSRMVNKFS